MPELSPQTPCDTCAFGKAGGATEPHNRLKGQICALGGLPFFCHHAPDGRELDWHGDSADYFRSLRNKKDRRVCAGWKREVRAYRSRGFFGKYRIIRRAVAQGALDSLVEFLADDTEAEEKLQAQHHLWRALRFLVRRNIGPLKIPLRSR